MRDFFSPSAVWFNSSHRQHDMSVRVSVPFVMQRPIGTHSFANKILHDVFAHGINLLLPGKFTRQRNFHFTRKLCCRMSFFTVLPHPTECFDQQQIQPEHFPAAILRRKPLRVYSSSRIPCRSLNLLVLCRSDKLHKQQHCVLYSC